MKFYCVLFSFCMLWSGLAVANDNARQVYQQSISLAAQGKLSESIVALQAAQVLLPASDIWRERMVAASVLLSMQSQQATHLNNVERNDYLMVASGYVKTQPLNIQTRIWPVTILAVVMPGAGHAWQGRWQDAGVATLFVFPLLILTLWAAKRRMGPVTVFFALLTAWLWSGTIFSAISLAERGNIEMYITWWQGLWQASGLPGKPW